MSISLQDVLDRVGAHPEKYGRGVWYHGSIPWCPLAVEILGEHFAHDECWDLIGALASALRCPAVDVALFVTWWDMEGSGRARDRLERLGYVVPPDAVRSEAKTSPGEGHSQW